MRQFRLTPNKTLFEYDDGIGDNNLIVYHPGYIRITEIDLFVQFANRTINVTHSTITNLCQQLYQTIHNRNYEWIIDGDFNYHNPSPIMTKIIGRLKCIADEFNEYIPYYNLRLRNAWDGEEYQSNLAMYILNTFISVIGEQETITLFAKHFGNIIGYLFNN